MNGVLEVSALRIADRKAHSHGKARRVIAVAGLSVYVGGLLTAMLWSFFASGDWFTGLLSLLHALLAALFAGGAMGMAMLCPDPYIAEAGEKPATLPDFD